MGHTILAAKSGDLADQDLLNPPATSQLLGSVEPVTVTFICSARHGLLANLNDLVAFADGVGGQLSYLAISFKLVGRNPDKNGNVGIFDGVSMCALIGDCVHLVKS